jgi:uncharacterized protein YbbK (DUF523 family)
MKIRLGISACLLGKAVRYDGGHKLDRYLTETLGKYVEYVPVCPEVECGMPVPREPMHLEGDPESPRLVTIKAKIDKTGQMAGWAEKRVIELEKEGLMGFIFKSDSPSSGMERVKVYNDKNMAVRQGVGIFARRFMEHFPLLPVEEEGRLHDPAIRENFIERVFALARWREFLAWNRSLGALVEFHTKHKMLISSRWNPLSPGCIEPTCYAHIYIASPRTNFILQMNRKPPIHWNLPSFREAGNPN